MCGIIGISAQTENDLGGILKQSLLWLTYRGYDSYGIALKTNGSLHIQKDKGRVERLNPLTFAKCRLGIGHTRWATHGEPSKDNAHPHVDCAGNIAVVHNGIIDNFGELRAQLIQQGHTFRSETDTEVIPHLIEEQLRRSTTGSADAFLPAFAAAVAELEGTYAIAAIWSNDDRIYAARKASPLVVGIGQGMHFVSSDIPAFLEHANRFVPLEDNQIAVLSGDNFVVHDLELQRSPYTEYECPFTVQDVSLDRRTFRHYMQKEILEQGEVVRGIWQGRKLIESVAKELAARLQKHSKVYFTGCGSSFHACLAAKHMFERLLHVPAEASLSSEFKGSVKNLTMNDSIIIALSQSGETLDTYGIVQQVVSLDPRPYVLGILNTRHSSLDRLATHKLGSNTGMLYIGAGPEICVVATKTYTAQLYLMSLLTLHVALEMSPPTTKGLIAESLREAQRIPDKIAENLGAWSEEARSLASRYTKYSAMQTDRTGRRETVFAIGRGINLATAFEVALKLKEICYISAEALPAGELKHGSLAVVDRHTPIVAIFPPSADDSDWKSTLNNYMEIRARGAPTMAVVCGNDANHELIQASTHVIRIPETQWLFAPVLQIIPFQLLAYMVAQRKNIDPDHPRNLAKTVTVE